MVTRKSASKTAGKTTPAKTARKAAAKAEIKHAAAEPEKLAAAPAKPRATPVGTATPAVPAAIEQRTAQTAPVKVPSGEERYRWIAHAAYLRAEKRGFEPGREVDDWLAAEAEFAAVFTSG